MESTYKLVYSQKIRLGQRILDLENFREIVNGAVGTFQSKTSLVLQAASCVDPNGDALALVLALSHSLNIFEVTHGPSEKLYNPCISEMSNGLLVSSSLCNSRMCS